MGVGRPRIAIVGGTGDLGGGLARRWAKAGYPVVIGSRAKEKAEQAVNDILQEAPGASVTGDENLAAAAAADIVVLTVPYANHRANLEHIGPALAGKILIDATVPLQPPKVAHVHIPPEGSAAVAAQQIVGPEVRVVSAFQNVGATHLREEHHVECDVLVSGDSVEARDAVLELVAAAGLRGWHAGPLVNSIVAESLTSVLIGINRRYGVDGAGIRITGEPAAAKAGK